MTGRWDRWHWQNGWFELGFQLGLGAIGRLSHNFMQSLRAVVWPMCLGWFTILPRRIRWVNITILAASKLVRDITLCRPIFAGWPTAFYGLASFRAAGSTWSWTRRMKWSPNDNILGWRWSIRLLGLLAPENAWRFVFFSSIFRGWVGCLSFAATLIAPTNFVPAAFISPCTDLSPRPRTCRPRTASPCGWPMAALQRCTSFWIWSRRQRTSRCGWTCH